MKTNSSAWTKTKKSISVNTDIVVDVCSVVTCSLVFYICGKGKFILKERDAPKPRLERRRSEFGAQKNRFNCAILTIVDSTHTNNNNNNNNDFVLSLDKTF